MWLVVDNKLSIHFGENKTKKSILFASRFKQKSINKPHIKYGDIKIKLHSKVLGCLLDETMYVEAMPLNSKINKKVEFRYHKNSF